MQNISDTDQNVKKLGELISGIKVAMMTTMMTTLKTTGTDQELHSRPMWTQSFDTAAFDGELWFFAGADSPKSHEIERDAHVALAYGDPDSNRYVAVMGRAEVVRDRAKAEELWNPLHKAWFPKGLDDPNLALILVRVEKAEYWDAPSSKVVQLAGFVKAALTGTPPTSKTPGMGEHKKLDLTG